MADSGTYAREELTEDDFSLIHALQLRPRATWAELAPVLQVAPSTLARRWARIREQGLAWVTAYPHWSPVDSPVMALVDVNCESRSIQDVCAVIARDSRVVTIEQAASGRDLLLTVTTGSFAGLSTLLIDQLPAVPGVASVRGHIVADVHVDGSAWRLDALGRAELRRLGRPDSGTPSESGALLVTSMPEAFDPLVAGLARDGRATAAALADEVGRPVSTVRRQLSTLVQSGMLNFRCEVSQWRTRWGISVTWWCRVPEGRRPALVAALTRHPMVRLGVTLTGATNFLFTMWVHDPADILTIQGWLEKQVPEVQIADVAVTLRHYKRIGWLLDPEGRATGEVVPIWPSQSVLSSPGPGQPPM